MNNRVIAAALALVAGMSCTIPAFADDQKKMLNQMAVQMWMQQQANQQNTLYNQSLINQQQATAAEIEWQRRNGSYPYKDQWGRAYGPYGYAPDQQISPYAYGPYSSLNNARANQRRLRQLQRQQQLYNRMYFR